MGSAPNVLFLPCGNLMQEHFDVLIVGAGISGIGAGYHLQAECPNRTYAILEGRESMGGRQGR